MKNRVLSPKKGKNYGRFSTMLLVILFYFAMSPFLPLPGRTFNSVHAADDCFSGCIDFETLTVGIQYAVGDTFSDSGNTFTVQPFTWSNGTSTSDGFAQVDNQTMAGHSG
ncbi:MAG: hypothetical protein DRH26_11480, partial [Deltaproteobacteria bacterium]